MKLCKRNNLVYGVGINDADYNVTKTEMVNGKQKKLRICPFHSRWCTLLHRCYSDKYQIHNSCYKGCSVCTEWLTFSVFKSWMEQQDWQGNQLDKDLIVNDNKEYSPSTSAFVPQAINLLMTDRCASRGDYPLGVYKRSNKFVSRLSVNGKRIHIGRFNTPEEASDAYKQAKSAHILDMIEQHPTLDERVKQSLTAIAEEMSS